MWIDEYWHKDQVKQRENSLEVKAVSSIWVLKVSLTRVYCLFVCFVILQTQDFSDWEVSRLPWRNAWCQGQWKLTWLSWMCRINEGSNWLEVKTLHHSWTDKLLTINNYSTKLIYWMKKPCNPLSSYIHWQLSINKQESGPTNKHRAFVKLRCRCTESFKTLNSRTAAEN